MGLVHRFTRVKVVTRSMPRCDSRGIFGCSKPLPSEWEIEAKVCSMEMEFWWKFLKGLNKACPTLIWWEVLKGFIRHGFDTWGVPQGVPKCFRGRGYGQNGLDLLDPKITTRAPPPSVRPGLGLGLFGKKHLNLILLI